MITHARKRVRCFGLELNRSKIEACEEKEHLPRENTDKETKKTEVNDKDKDKGQTDKDIICEPA